MPQIRRRGTSTTTVVADDDPRLTDDRFVRVDLPRATKAAKPTVAEAAAAHKAAVAESIDTDADGD